MEPTRAGSDYTIRAVWPHYMADHCDDLSSHAGVDRCRIKTTHCILLDIHQSIIHIN